MSTDEQKLGNHAQRAAIEQWAKERRVAVCAWAEEKISSGEALSARVGLFEAIALLTEHRAGLFVVLRRDRLARDVGMARAIERHVEEHGARVMSADGVGNGQDPADQFMRTLLDATAEYERALIRARIKAALDVKRRRGEAYNHAPWGSKVQSGKLVPEPREQAIERELKRLSAEGLSLRQLETVAKRVGMHSRTGRPLSFNSIARIVRR